MIVDTTFVIDLMRKDKKAIEKLLSLYSKGEPVLTRNVQHFSRIPGLKVETY